MSLFRGFLQSSGTEKFKYVGEMLVGAAGSSPGLYYIGARWMDSELGRFVSLDPQLGKLSMPQSMNRYVYCVNNPLRFTDPTGEWFGISLKTTLQVIIIVVAVAATVATAGIASPLAAMAVGAAIGAISSAASTAAAGGSLSDIATSALIGGVAGAIGGGAGAIIAKKAATMASKQAAEKLMERLGSGFGGKLNFVEWGAKLSRVHKIGMTFGKEGGSGFFAKGTVLAKPWGSVGELVDVTGSLRSGLPDMVTTLRANRAFWAIERPGVLGGGTLDAELVIPYSTAEKYLRIISQFDLGF